MDFTRYLSLGRQVLDFHVFEISGTSVTVATLLTFVLILIATLWLAKVLSRTVLRALRLWGVRDEGSLGALGHLIQYLGWLLGFAVALQTIGIDLSALFAAGALFAVGIGFATRNILENFLSGVILLSDRAIKPGDVLEVEGRMVKVVNIGIRATVARTRDEEDLILPNSILVQTTVKNFTLRDPLHRLRTRVGVVYGSDMKRVVEVLNDAAAAHPHRFPGRDPVVLMREFGDSSVVFDVSIWIEDPWSAGLFRSTLNESVWWALKDAGITIAFPQLDLHLDEPVVESLRGLAGAKSA